MGNTSVEQANGDAKAVTGSTAPPEKKDHKRRPGETDQEYLERMRQEANQRPASRELMGQKADELRDMRDSIQSDPHYPAWRQNISPEAYNNPTSFPGVSENKVLSQGAGGDREATMSIANTSPYSFMAADGKIYSGDANSGVYQPSGVNGTLASASSMYGRITGADPHWADAAAVHPVAGPFGDNQNPMALGHAMQRPSGTVQQRQAAEKAKEKEKEKEKEKKPEDGVSVKGEPVEVTRGEYIETWRDFVIPGSVELDGSRFMAMELASPEGVSSPLGACQRSVFDEVIVNPSPGALAWYDAHGRVIAFDRPFNFLASRNDSYPQFELRAPWLKQLALTERRVTKHFTQFADRVYRLVAIEDQRGPRAEFERTPEGLLTAIKGPDGLSLRFTNDSKGRRVAVELVGTDGSVMPLARYAYDERGRMTSADCTLGMSVRYAWHAERDLLTGWRDVAGRSEARFTHDADGRVVHTATSGAWNDDRFHYDREARATRYVPGGDDARAESFDYDDRDRVTAHTDALGYVTTYAYDASGHRTGVTDALGATTGLAFDAWGNITAVSDGAGRETRYRRGSRGEVLVIVDGEGASRRFEHDERGNVIAARDAEGHETRYAYDERGNLTEIRHPDGAVERRSYDQYNRLIERSDARGASTRYGWDVFHRCVTVERPDGGVTRIEYEPSAGGLRAPTRVVRPDGVSVTRRYDVDGSVSEQSDGAGRVWRYEHGAFGVLRAVTDPTGARLTVSHDPEGRVASVTNARGLVYRFERDVAGRIIAEIDYDGRRTDYVRDAVGRIVRATLPDGSRIAFEHDGAGLVTRVRAFARVTGELQEELSFAFDGRGLMTSATSLSGAVTFARDRNGRVVRESAQGRTIEHRRDARGARVERRIGERVVRYERDAAGDLRALTIGEHDPLEFTRDLDGRELRRASARGFAVDQRFDEAGRLVSQRGAAASREYGWSSADTLVSIRGGLWGDVSYERDARDQIVRATRSDGGVEAYSYDAAMDVTASWGAVASSERSGDPAEALPASVWIRTAGGAVEGAYGPRGERVTLTHDACGRVVARQVERRGFRPQTWRYEWDALGRLASCVTPKGERWTYGYDAFGRRLWKRRADAPRDASEVGRAYLWDGDHIAAEAPMRRGGAIDWAAGVSWHFGDDGHRPIAREEGEALHYVVCDHLGTPRELADEAGGVAFARELSVWGATLATYPAGRDEMVPLRFQGQWADEETGLYYNRFRHYDPLAGQYATPDPVGLLGGVRPHGYAPDPSGWVDPLGLDADKPKKGDKVYRVYGGDAKPDGASWTPDDPRLSPNYRDAAGLPSGGPEAGGAVNSGRFLVEGTLNDPGAVVLQRPAIGLDGTTGGAREWIIPNGMGSGAITPTGVWGVNPQF